MTGGSNSDDRVRLFFGTNHQVTSKVYFTGSVEGVKITYFKRKAKRKPSCWTTPSSKRSNEIENTVETKQKGTKVFVYKRALKKWAGSSHL